jgi:hypothetical protein
MVLKTREVGEGRGEMDASDLFLEFEFSPLIPKQSPEQSIGDDDWFGRSAAAKPYWQIRIPSAYSKLISSRSLTGRIRSKQ